MWTTLARFDLGMLGDVYVSFSLLVKRRNSTGLLDGELVGL